MGRDPLVFYFDFASPYAWIALDGARRIAEEAGRVLELRPMLLWALFKEQQIPPPMEPPARRAYMLADMARSAAYRGVALKLPEPLQVSTHLAKRLWLGLARERPEAAFAFARRLYEARFVEGKDLREAGVLREAAAEFGLSAEAADRHMAAAENREALAASISGAVQAGVCGAPFLILDGEGFFGADRLEQIRWRLGLPPSAPAS